MDEMNDERTRWRIRLTGSAATLAAEFDKRRLNGARIGDLVGENIAALSAAGVIPSGGPRDFEATLAENVDLLRIVAGGCGRTAFATSALLTEENSLRHGHLLDAAVFLGLAERAFRLAVQRIKDRSNTAAADPAQLPGTQFAVARMRADVATMGALLAGYVDDDSGGDWGGYLPRYYVAGVAERVVSAAFEIIGGGDPEAGEQIGWAWQDLKTGPVLPFSNDLALEVIGKAALGIDRTQTPRWL